MGDEQWRDHQAAEIHRLRALLKQARWAISLQRARAELWKQRALEKTRERNR